VDSEFFHGKNWEVEKKRIKTNTEFWHQKIDKNIKRDLDVNKFLDEDNWKVLRFWSKEVKNNLNECVHLIENAIKEFSKSQS